MQKKYNYGILCFLPLNKFYMLLNSKRHFFCHWTFSFHTFVSREMARDFSCCPRVVLHSQERDREKVKIMNARNDITCKKAFGRWSVDRLQHAGHYNWHTMCEWCKWYTRKRYTSFDCFSSLDILVFVNRNKNYENDWNCVF